MVRGAYFVPSMTYENAPFRTLNHDVIMKQPNTPYVTPVSPMTPNTDIPGEQEQDEEEKSTPALPHRHMETTAIGNHSGMRKYYENRFWAIKQKACREIAKAWVKTVHPKKQATNPYNGGKDAGALGLVKKSKEAHDLKKPKWWPVREEWWPEGEECLHVEPDHQPKWSRICLLLKIIEKCGDEDGPAPPENGEITRIKVSVAQLEASANEIRNTYLDDDGARLLDEIYIMKHKELKVLRGEIGKRKSLGIPDHHCR